MDDRSEERNSDRAEKKKYEVLMWGYFPGVAQQRSPLTSPEAVRIPVEDSDGDSWKDVCGGGCGFGMALTGSFFVLYDLVSVPFFDLLL